MISKSTTGKSFRGLINYLESDEKVEWKEVHNLPSQDSNLCVKLMDNTASLSKAEKPVYHLSISYAEADNPTKEMMIEDGHRVLEKLGLSDHQAVFIGHSDKDYKHFHIMVNRVDFQTGRAWNPWQDAPKRREVLREIERERGYEIVPFRKREKSLSRGEFSQLKNGGMPLVAKAEFYEFNTIFEQAKGWEDVRVQLQEAGCKIKRKGRGAVIEDVATGKTLKLSRVGREYSLGRLEQRFGRLKDYEQVRELIPEKKLRKSFWELEKTGSAEAGKNFGRALKYSRDFSRAVKGLTALASSSNPVAGIAKSTLNIAKGIQQELNQNRGLER